MYFCVDKTVQLTKHTLRCPADSALIYTEESPARAAETSHSWGTVHSSQRHNICAFSWFCCELIIKLQAVLRWLASVLRWWRWVCGQLWLSVHNGPWFNVCGTAHHHAMLMTLFTKLYCVLWDQICMHPSNRFIELTTSTWIVLLFWFRAWCVGH